MSFEKPVKTGGFGSSRLRNVWIFSADWCSTQVELVAMKMRIFPSYVQPFLLRIGSADFAYIKSICAGEGMTNGPKSTPFSPRHDTSLRSLHGWHRTSVDCGFQSFYRTEDRKVRMKSVLHGGFYSHYEHEQLSKHQTPLALTTGR